MEIIGNKYLVDFGSAKAILYFKNQTSLTFTITQKDEAQVNITETVVINIVEIRPSLFIVTWKEVSGTNVVQIQDHENGVVYSNWSSATGAFTQQKGAISPYATITVGTTIKASVADCWQLWTTPEHILHFNNPFDDWHTAKVEIDLKTGGRYYYRMEAKDGSTGFDFAGHYSKIITNELMECIGDDGRKTLNLFSSNGGADTSVTEIFEPDTTTPLELQRDFCQTILDSFKQYAERTTAEPHS